MFKIMIVIYCSQPSWQNPQKNNLKKCIFVNSAGTQNTVPCCQKYTLTDGFFGDFAHWEVIKPKNSLLIALFMQFVGPTQRAKLPKKQSIGVFESILLLPKVFP